MLPNQIWVFNGQSIQGPYTIPQIQAKLAAGEVTWGTKIYPVGATEWLPLHSVPGLVPDAQRPAGARGILTTSAPIGSAPLQPRPLSQSRWIRRAMIGIGALLIAVVGSYLLRSKFTSYERGYGDTILRYKDRSYDAAKWTKIEDLSSISNLASPGPNLKELFRIAGWDNDNLWVADQTGQVLQLRDGHWESPVKAEQVHYPTMRVENSSTLLIAGRNLYRLSPGNVVDIGVVNQNQNGELFPADDDLLYSYRKGVDPIRFSEGERKEFKVENSPEASVQNSDNLPLRGHLVADIRHVRPVRPGLAYGVSSSVYGKKNLVRFKDKYWRDFKELPDKEVQDLWLSGSEDAPHEVLVGKSGWVYEQPATGGGAERTLVASISNPTPMNLIKVWGASPDKFWVMDDHGTIWELNRSKSIIKVPGMRQNDVTFRDAWVSPTGTVFAITTQHLYRLD